MKLDLRLLREAKISTVLIVLSICLGLAGGVVGIFQARQISTLINQVFLDDVRHRNPGDMELARRVSLIDESGNRRVRMANLAIVGSHAVNGVSALHTDLMRRTLFADFERFFPGRITNITNGITPRRWLNEANPRLGALIASRVSCSWVTDLDCLRGMERLAGDGAFQQEFLAVKRANKERLAGLIRTHLREEVDPTSLFDVQIKRIHEYKRQLLNILSVIARYNRIRADPAADVVPRTVIFAGKAAPSYALAKLIIKLIHQVADVIDNDPALDGRLKVVFIPNYDVSTACDIIPAADLSEQISTAGLEASGTGNMKLALNGALTLGTLDGATVEICEAVGEENIFVFGLTAAEVLSAAAPGTTRSRTTAAAREIRQALDMIAGSCFSPHDPLFRPIVDSLTAGGDFFLVLADFEVRGGPAARRSSLPNPAVGAPGDLNVARMGRFSIDRTVDEYAEKIWGLESPAGARGQRPRDGQGATRRRSPGRAPRSRPAISIVAIETQSRLAAQPVRGEKGLPLRRRRQRTARDDPSRDGSAELGRRGRDQHVGLEPRLAQEQVGQVPAAEREDRGQGPAESDPLVVDVRLERRGHRDPGLVERAEPDPWRVIGTWRAR
jgi:glycogen/starch/alpha-glucan phosphorylase-like protein